MRTTLRSMAMVAVMSAATTVACGPVTAPSPAPGSGSDLNVDNETDLPVEIVVNGLAIGVGAAHDRTTFPGGVLPPMPWRVEARSPSGRLVLALDVQADSISRTVAPDGQVSMHGAGARIDLSCGRLDLWVGVPMLGPAPGPGVPGDCGP